MDAYQCACKGNSEPNFNPKTSTFDLNIETNPENLVRSHLLKNSFTMWVEEGERGNGKWHIGEDERGDGKWHIGEDERDNGKWHIGNVSYSPCWHHAVI